MTRIGIISDTHALWDPKFDHYLGGLDEVWHAGDIGSEAVANRFEALGVTFRAVVGNIDGQILRRRYPEVLRFWCEEVEVLMKHIGGYPGRYDASIRAEIAARPPQLFVSGHSHILRVMPDKRLHLLHINPGAAGLQGWHQERTIVRIAIDGSKITDCEVVTLGHRGAENPQ